MTAPRRGVTLVEVLVAIAIVAVVLPALIDTQLTVRRMDVSQTERSQSTHLAGAVLETIHYRMYNGYRTDPNNPDTLVDVRGFKLNDPRDARRQAQQRGSPLAFFNGLPERDTAALTGPGRRQSAFLAPLGDLVTRARAGAPRPDPSESRWLERFGLEVGAVMHLDDAPAPPRVTKNYDEPVVDMALVRATLSWNDAVRGQPVTRVMQTRFTRYLYEEDVAESFVGQQVVW